LIQQSAPTKNQGMDVALVTGGGGEGSGRAIARRFARDGAHVIVCDIDPAGAEQTVELIVRDGGRAAHHTTDVRSREQLEEAFKFARSFGNITTVVNNASDTGSFHPEAPLDYWDEIVQTDFLGAMWSTRLGIDALRESGGGAIVNVSSTSALRERAEDQSPIYDVAKLAILRLSMRLAFLKRENIRVNCIIPHWIAVPFLIEYFSGLSAEERLKRGVPERLIPTDEIADAVFRLATNPALAGEAIGWPDGGKAMLLRSAGDASWA
jgi:NAD(P)-dependent dehydrogenase (short-subunit alcohol dehydrogenase family)